MQLFQLVAKGTCAVFQSSSRSICSKKVFVSKDMAEAYKEEFATKCSTPLGDKDLYYLESDLKINIVELELIGSGMIECLRCKEEFPTHQMWHGMCKECDWQDR